MENWSFAFSYFLTMSDLPCILYGEATIIGIIWVRYWDWRDIFTRITDSLGRIRVSRRLLDAESPILRLERDGHAFLRIPQSRQRKLVQLRLDRDGDGRSCAGRHFCFMFQEDAESCHQLWLCEDIQEVTIPVALIIQISVQAIGMIDSPLMLDREHDRIFCFPTTK